MASRILLKNGILVDLEPLKLEQRDILIADGRVVRREEKIQPKRSWWVVDCRGRYIFPGFVNAQSRLHLSQLLGMPEPGGPPVDSWIAARQELERRLGPETVVTSTFAGAIDAVRSGTTTVLDRHASPAAVAGSLDLVRDAILTVGLRAVLCYETGDTDTVEAAIEENRRFARENRGDKTSALIGSSDASQLESPTLESLARLCRDYERHLVVDLGETPRNGTSPLKRLEDHGLLDGGIVGVHGTNLDADDVKRLADHGGWIVHCPTSNLRSGAGVAPLETFGELAAVGTDGITNDMFGEIRAAYLQGRARSPEITPQRVIDLIVGGHQLASELLGLELGSTRRGAGADFVILDYRPNTPIDSNNLADHIVFGMGPQHVESVMVDGSFVYRQGRFPNVDVRKLTPLLRRGARQLWTGEAVDENVDETSDEAPDDVMPEGLADENVDAPEAESDKTAS